MAQLGVLFDATKLGGALPGYTAFRILFSLVDAQRLNGSTLLHGAVETEDGAAASYCLAIEAHDPGILRMVKAAFRNSQARGLLPPASRFIEDHQLVDQTLEALANIGERGELVDCAASWLQQAWQRAREQPAAPSPSAPAAAPRRAVTAPVSRRLAAPASRRSTVRVPESGVRWVATCAFICLGIAVGAGVIVHSTLAGFSASAPSILAMGALAGWAAAMVWTRWWRVRSYEQQTATHTAEDVARVASSEGVAALEKHTAAGRSPLMVRAHAVARAWQTRPNLAAAYHALERASAMESDARKAAYRAPMLLTIALVGAGGVGSLLTMTAPAIACAVALATLLSCLASLLDGRELRLAAAAEQGVLDVILPGLQAAAPEDGSSGGRMIRELIQELRETGGRLLQTFQTQAEEAAQRLNQQQTQAAAEIVGKLVGLRESLEESHKAVAAQQVELVNATAQLAKSARTIAEAIGELERLDDFSRTMTEVRRSIEALGPVLSRFQEPFVLQAVPMPPRAARAAAG